MDEKSLQRGKRGFSWWKLALLIVFVSFAAIVFYYWLEYRQLQATGAAAFQAAVAETEALEPDWRWSALLARGEALPEQENAWPLVERLGKMVRDSPKRSVIHHIHHPGKFPVFASRLRFPHSQSLLPKNELTVIRHYVEGQTAIRDLLRQLSRYRRARAPLADVQTDGQAWQAVLTSVNYATLGRSAAEMFFEDALHDSRWADTFTFLLAQLVLAETMRDHPLLVSQTRRCLLHERIVAQLERWLQFTTPPEEELHELQSRLEEALRDNPFQKAWPGWRYIGSDFFAWQQQTGELPPPC